MAKKKTSKEPAQQQEQVLALSSYLESLDPLVLSFALVGRFFAYWALMETELNRVITSALGMNKLQGSIVTAEIDFSKKVFMARTSVKYRINDKEAAKYEKLLLRLAKLSEDRNIIAHNAFLMTDRKDGVSFFTRKARGNLDLDSKVYTIHQWESMVSEIDEATAMLEELSGILKKNTNPAKLGYLLPAQNTDLGVFGRASTPLALAEDANEEKD